MTTQNLDSRTFDIEKLACRPNEARALLGGISSTTLWRLEKRGLLMPIPGLRHKLYSVEALRRFAQGKGSNQ